MTVQQIVDAFVSRGDRLSEATFRKYVQLGLLPRSVRVGRKGKHRGSQGMYPATVVRQLDRIRRLMAQGFTMEEIQRDFLFIRGDIDDLQRRIASILSDAERNIVETARGSSPDEVAAQALEEARVLGDQLVRKMSEVEQRLAMRARMARAVV